MSYKMQLICFIYVLNLQLRKNISPNTSLFLNMNIIFSLRFIFFDNVMFLSKMRRTDSKVDFGRYTCIAGGKVADIEVRFHSRKEAARKKRQMDYYLKEQLFS